MENTGRDKKLDPLKNFGNFSNVHVHRCAVKLLIHLFANLELRNWQKYAAFRHNTLAVVTLSKILSTILFKTA